MVLHAIFYKRKHKHRAIVERSGWSQAHGLFLAEAQIATATTQADVSEKISGNAMVNHKCPALFLLTLRSQQPQCTPLSS